MKSKLLPPPKWPVITLVISLTITVLAWLYIRGAVIRQEADQFQFVVKQHVNAISEKLTDEIHLLQGGAGYYYGVEKMTRAGWKAYADALQATQAFTGVQGLGFSRWLAPENLEAHVQQVRAEGFPNYQVNPRGEREAYTAIMYLEPFDERNQRAFGFDMFSEPVRREAMERARDTGEFTLSGMVTLVQETDVDVQKGFLIYIPVYHKGAPRNSIEQRRASLYGFVYSPFRSADFLNGLFPQGLPYTQIEIFDGLETTDEFLMVSSVDQSALQEIDYLSQDTVIEVAGRTWTIRVFTNPAFAGLLGHELEWFVLGGGFLLSFGLALIVLSQQQSRTRAKQLELSEGRMFATLYSIGDGVISTDLSGRITDLNYISENLTGWTLEEARGREIGEVFHIVSDETREPASIPVDEVLATGELHGMANHTILISRDGSERAISESAAPIRDPSGKVLGVVLIFRDVTEEQRLAAEQMRLAAIVESSEDAIISRSLDGIITSWNPGAENLFGYKSAEVLGSPITLIIPDEHIDEELRIPERLDKGEFVSYFETLRIPKSGHPIDVAVTVSLIKDSDGEVIGISNIVRDITARKQAQTELARFNTKLEHLVEERTDALEEQKAHLQAMLDNLAEGVMGCDAKGRFTQFNKVAAKWHGCDPRDMSTQQWLESFDVLEEDGTTPIPTNSFPLQRALAGKKFRNFGMTLAVKGQTPRHLIASGGPIHDANGVLLGATIILYDMTERLASMEEMKRAMKILDATDDGAFIFDAESYEFTYVNEGGVRLIGYSREEILQMSPLDLAPQFSVESFAKELEFFLDESNNLLSMRHKDGHDIPVEFNLQLSRSDNERTSYIAIVRDTTERKQAEDNIRALNADLEDRIKFRTQELELARNAAESASRAKSSFLATMSHEIRTPMNGIIGTIDVMMQSSLQPRQLEFADTIKDSAYSLLTVIDDILDFSKIEAEKIELEREPVMLSYLIESVCNAMLAIANKENVQLSFYQAPSLPAAILSDALRLRQILTNLVNNAIKFSGKERNKKGEVAIRLESGATGELVITVRDNGIGMPEKVLNTIFDAFTQADSSTTRRFGGTGLGLPICKRLVDVMEGTLTVESEIDEGSLFTVRLPVEALDNPEVSETHNKLGSVICHLYAEDSVVRDNWRNWLGHEGATIRQLDTVEAGIKEMATAPNEGIQQIAVLVENTLSVDEYRALIDKNELAAPSRVIVIRPLLNQKITVVNELLVLIDQHPNLETSFSNVLDFITSGGASRSAAPDTEENRSEIAQVLTEEQAATAGRLVLVAEDNEINRKVIVRQLELLNYVCDIACDGREALEMWSQKNYSILVTDLQMPVMDGYELTRIIRSQEKQDRHLPILAFTANATKGEKSRCIEIGMDDYLSKPVPLETLQEKLAEWGNRET